jgi:prolyl oligopeptidase
METTWPADTACHSPISIANNGTKLYLRTNENAPQYQVITIDLADPSRQHKVLIPELKDAYLDDITAVGDDKLAVVYKRNVRRAYPHTL